MSRRPKYDLIESSHDDIVKATCKIATHNTLRYELSDGSVCYQLHDTVVVQIFSDGKFKLDSGGWRTVTTKARMNEFMPSAFNLHQERGVWYLMRGYWNDPDRERVSYYDGMVVDPSQPLVEEGAGAEEAQRVKGLIKKIGAYCRALRKHIEKNGVPMPNNGDCWFCMMQDVETGKSLGESSGDKDHLISHLDEKYIHGSLIWRALISRRPEQGAATIMQMGFVDIIVGEVRNYFKRQLGIA